MFEHTRAAAGSCGPAGATSCPVVRHVVRVFRRGPRPQRRRLEDDRCPVERSVLEDLPWWTVLYHRLPGIRRAPAPLARRRPAGAARHRAVRCHRLRQAQAATRAWPTSHSSLFALELASARRWTTDLHEFRALARRSVDSFGTTRSTTWPGRCRRVPDREGLKEAETCGLGCRRSARPVGAAQGGEAVIGDAARRGPDEACSATTSRRAAQRLRALGVRRVADLPHRPLPRQGGGAEHPRVPLRERALRPMGNRNFIDHVQIDIPELVVRTPAPRGSRRTGRGPPCGCRWAASSGRPCSSPR